MSSFDQTIDLMLIDLEQVEGTLILFGVCDDIVLRDYAIDTLRKRLPAGITLHDFRYDPEHLSLLEGAVEVTASGNGRPAVSVTGFEALPRDKRTEAIRLLNRQRGRFGHTGIAVILWVDRATLSEISTWSADFYSWRSTTFIIEPPPEWNTLESARRGYLQALVSQNEFVNMQGLAPVRSGQVVQMRMEDIFIPLHVEQAARFSEKALFAEAIPAEVIAKHEELQEIKRRISAEESPLWERYAFRAQHEIKAHRVEIPELLQERQAVVLGDPGAGKTTLLRYIAYTLAQAQISQCRSEIISRTPDLANCLPVYVRMGEYAQHLQHNPEATLDSFAPLGCQAHQLPLSDELFRDALARGSILFLLDSLDEIIDTTQRREVGQRVEAFVRAHPQCRVVVTSRIVGYRETQLGGAFAQFTISPFAPENIRRFAQNWYAALGVPEDAETLVQAIEGNPSILRLATNPLLLTVNALIHWRGTKLPRQRVKLYSQAAETLVYQWMSQRRVSPEGWDAHETLQLLLPAIAWHLHSFTSSGLIGEHELHSLLVETLRQHDPHMRENETHSRASQFRRNVSEFSGIFLERGLDQDGRGLYGFLHLTFEEYFAALHMAEQWERAGDTVREGRKVLTPLLHNPRWTEVLLLTAGHLGESSQYRATRFVQTILAARSAYENLLHRDLFMAAQCLADDVRVDASLRRTISGKLLNLYFDRESPGALREDIRKIFARLGGTNVEKDVLAVLTERLTDTNADARRAAAEALEQLGTAVAKPAVISALFKSLTDSERHVREAAARALGQFGTVAATPEVVSALFRLLMAHESSVRWAAAWALGKMGQAVATPEVFSTLLKRLSDPVWEVRDGAARALTQLGQLAATPEIVSALLRLLTVPDSHVRGHAVGVLGQLGRVTATPKVMAALLKCLTDEDDYVRGVAARALGQLGAAATTPEVITVLLKYLTDFEGKIQQAAAEALGEMGQVAATPQVLSALVKLLTDSNSVMRRAAVKALGQMGQAAVTPQVLPNLFRLLIDPDRIVRQAAAEALGQMGQTAATPQILSALLEPLADPEEYVRATAARALGHMGKAVYTSEVLSALCKLLTDSAGKVREAVAEALGEIDRAAGTLEVLSALLSFLNDSDWYVRWPAAAALGNLSTSVRPQDRSEAMKLFLPLARSSNAEHRNTGYVGLRNLLAGGQGDSV